jgi:tagaturonate reductase
MPFMPLIPFIPPTLPQITNPDYMQRLSRKTHPRRALPERILQFGGGNFMRAFVEWHIQTMNEKIDYGAGVAIVKSTDRPDAKNMINEQDGLYTLYLLGMEDGQPKKTHQVIDCVQRQINAYAEFEALLKAAKNPELQLVFSNTTEAGIVYVESDQADDAPPSSFPGKLTRVLWERYQALGGSAASGLVIIPCELIDRNGDKLKEIILQMADNWGLEAGFKSWLNEHCTFCNTLVDRIVPGYPKDKIEAITAELGYQDHLVVEGERFHLWVIEGPKRAAELLPAPKAGLNVIFTDDLALYRTRKVRVLNGAHTAMVPVGYLAGLRTVKDAVEDEAVGKFVREMIFEEVIPHLPGDQADLKQYGEKILERFFNPYLKHYLSSIALNSTSKFSTRLLPSLLVYVEATGELPERIVLALAALIRFYAGEVDGEIMPLKDDQDRIDFMAAQWQAQAKGEQSLLDLVQRVLAQADWWEGKDLNEVPQLAETLAAKLERMMAAGHKPKKSSQ